MTSAKERAVEAGARAMARDHYEVRFGPGDHAEININANWHIFADPARIALRAAFPILAEELVKEIEAEADDLEQIAQDYLDGKHPGKPDLWKRTASDFRERSDAVRQMAPALRARIQQMAEAL